MTKFLRYVGVSLLLIFSLEVSSQNLQISGGNNFSSVVCNQQQVNVSGYNKDGQLGTDAAGNPIALGTFRSAWGPVTRGTLGATPLNTGPDVMPAIRQADAGSGGHLLGLDCAKNVWAWGLNDAGQLGRNNSGAAVSNSVPMRVLKGAQVVAGSFLSNISYVSGGNNSSFAIEETTGRVLAWGSNDYGQLGDGTVINRLTPVYVLTAAATPLTNIVQIEAGDNCTYALDASGQVWSWGQTHDGAFQAYNLGRPFAGEIVAAPGGGTRCIPYAGRVVRGTNNNDDAATNGFLDDMVSISGGDTHGLALDANGQVWSWGGDWATGQLGQGNGGQYQPKAGRVVDIGVTAATGPFLGHAGSNYRAISIAAGQSSSAIVLRNITDPTNNALNRVVTFGSNGLYEFGNLITQAGTTTCTGNNRFGSGTLGRGSCNAAACGGQGAQNENTDAQSYEYPVLVLTAAATPLSGVTTVSDGDAWYFATNDVGANAVAWGWNRRGELANGSFSDNCYATSLSLPASCAFDYPCPGQPKLPANFTSCPVFSSILDAQVDQTQTTYKYNWQYRATPGSGAWTDITGQGTTSGALKTTIVTSTNNETYTANLIGEYRVLISDTRTSVAFLCAPCPVLKDSVSITEVPNPYTTDGCSGTPNSTFSITNPPGSKIIWWDAPTGGTRLNPADSLTSITVATTTAPVTPACGSGQRALFAEDVASMQGVTIKTGALTPTTAQIATATGCATGSWSNTGGDQNELMIEVFQTAKLNSVSIIVSAGYNINTTKNLEIYNNNPTGNWCGGCGANVDGKGTQIAGSPVAYTVNYTGGSGYQVITIPIGITLAPGKYWLKAASFNEMAYFNCNRTMQAGALQYLWQTPYDDDIPTATVLQAKTNYRSGNYSTSGSLFDIRFETGTGYTCGRILVCQSSTACPLPVEMLYFEASKNGTTALLEWATASEQNSKNFIVQRSSDGINWAPIGTVSAAGNSNTALNYSFVDESPLLGLSYYRLVQVDLDGTESISPAQTVTFGSDFALSIHPNPSKDGLFQISVTGGDADASQIRVYTLLGQVVQESSFAGNYSGTLNLSSLNKGVYVVKVISGSQSKSISIVIE